LPLSPLVAFTMMEPPIFPLVGSNRTALEFERPFNRMESAAECKLDFRLRWIKLDDEFLHLARRSKRKRGERYAELEAESHSNSPLRHGHGCHPRHVLNNLHPKSIISATLSDESGKAPA